MTACDINETSSKLSDFSAVLDIAPKTVTYSKVDRYHLASTAPKSIVHCDRSWTGGLKVEIHTVMQATTKLSSTYDESIEDPCDSPTETVKGNTDEYTSDPSTAKAFEFGGRNSSNQEHPETIANKLNT